MSQEHPKRPTRRAKAHLISTDGELKRPMSVPQQAGKPQSMFPQKGGSAFRPAFPEYHFSTSLYIDDAIRTLEIYVGKLNESRPQEGIRVCETEVIDSDHAKFRLRIIPPPSMFSLAVELVGTMERWEGSHTRIDATVRMVIPAGGIEVNNTRPVDILDRIVMLGAGLLFTFIGFVTQYLLILLLGVIIAVLVFLPNKGTVSTPGRIPERDVLAKARRRADELAGILSAAYQGYDVQWIDNQGRV